MDRKVFAVLASKARKLREDRNIAVDDMARRIGLTAESLNRFESAEERIELDKLVCLVNVLGVPLISLYMLDEGKG